MAWWWWLACSSAGPCRLCTIDRSACTSLFSPASRFTNILEVISSPQSNNSLTSTRNPGSKPKHKHSNKTVHQRWNPWPGLSVCYIFMWANISDRSSHVGRHVFIQPRSLLFSTDISITWVTSLASSLWYLCVTPQYTTLCKSNKCVLLPLDNSWLSLQKVGNSVHLPSNSYLIK